MRLKGLQSVTEYSKIRSNGILLNYPTEQDRNNMPNKVFVHKNFRRDSTKPLRKKNRNKKILLMATVLNQLFFDQREKGLIGKHTTFSMEKFVLQIRSTLIAVKVGTKLVPYLFKPLF